jgi:creatinine amidohydrolase
VRLGAAAWPDLEGTGPLVLIVPLGATEQHGPHLPLETDTLIAVAVAEAVGAARDDVAVAPALPYGSSGEHAGFPGTLSLGQEALELALVELVRSADRFDAVVLASWHGGNAEPLVRAVARLRAEGRRVVAWDPRPGAADLHAGRTETSLVLALAPERVGRARPVGVVEPLEALLPQLRARGVRAVSPNGVLGDATGAGPEEGRAIFARLVDDLAACVDASLAA